MKKLNKILLIASIILILISLSIFAFIKTLSSKVERIDIDRSSITEVSKGTVPENSDEVISEDGGEELLEGLDKIEEDKE